VKSTSLMEQLASKPSINTTAKKFLIFISN
jgi:hypothetical protein